MYLEGLLQRDMLAWGLWRGGGKARPDPLLLCQNGISKVHNGEAEMTCRGSIVATLNQFRNGATNLVIPMALDFACIICHVVAGARKGETISRWTRERGGRDAQGTDTLSIVEVSGGRRRCPGARHAKKASISTTCGIAKSSGASHSSCTPTVPGRRLMRMFLCKGEDLQVLRVGCAEDGITN